VDRGIIIGQEQTQLIAVRWVFIGQKEFLGVFRSFGKSNINSLDWTGGNFYNIFEFSLD
jgi:hypothetical protein